MCSESLSWRTTTVSSLKEKSQAKVHFNSKLLWICWHSVTHSKTSRRTRRNLLCWVSPHTASSATHPGQEKLAGLVMNECLQSYFHYKTSHNAEVLYTISTQCYFLCTVQLAIKPPLQDALNKQVTITMLWTLMVWLLFLTWNLLS